MLVWAEKVSDQRLLDHRFLTIRHRRARRLKNPFTMVERATMRVGVGRDRSHSTRWGSLGL
jgi:hypothetical protein